jgi:hypothetical protein
LKNTCKKRAELEIIKSSVFSNTTKMIAIIVLQGRYYILLKWKVQTSDMLLFYENKIACAGSPQSHGVLAKMEPIEDI